MADQLQISDFKVSVAGKQVVKGLSLQIKPGEIHALMGPNGSGKSSLASALAGHPAYEVDGGSVRLNGKDLLELSPDERAVLGLFLAFQYPVEVPGVRVNNFLRAAHQVRFAQQPEKQFAKVLEFRKYLEEKAREYGIDTAFLKRGLNDGFSGGEKKQLEILQAAILAPTFAILDETDSGLDIDAIKKVAAGVKNIVSSYKTGILVITHYQRILEYLQPDFVHVMVDGVIVRSGDASLVKELESSGYGAWKEVIQ